MADFVTTISQNTPLSDDEQKKLSQPAGDDMNDEHKNYLAIIMDMLDRKEIDSLTPDSILKHEQYDRLDELAKGKVDGVLVSLCVQLSQIEDFYRNKKTPNASPELENMIDHLWQMKDRVEKEFGDVYKL